MNELIQRINDSFKLIKQMNYNYNNLQYYNIISTLNCYQYFITKDNDYF